MPRKAIIIGAGPAGLTAAYELLKRTDIIPVILEKSGDIGGISKTVNYKGNRIDIGGHRFFSKSDRVMKWWMNILPVEPLPETGITVTYQRKHRTIKNEEVFPRQSDHEPSDKVMLIRNRLSRIYFLRKFFTYPISLSLDTLRKLGIPRTAGILFSYLHARLFPRKPERNLEDFFINRFGNKLYRLFFKDYTEKVWGIPCTGISAEWGAQRVKGISIAKAIAHAARSLKPRKKALDIHQKGTETSLIERFLYPKFGPGQLWEEVARQVTEMGGTILMHQEVRSIQSTDNQITAIDAINTETGETTRSYGDYFFSTMPVKELIAGMNEAVPEYAREVAAGLQYRDFITVGVLLKKLSAPDTATTTSGTNLLPDTWIYIQEKDVKVGRLQIFNNWSPFMVKDADTVWIGMEYFCNTEDALWQQSDEVLKDLAVSELDKMGLAKAADVLDRTVIRMEKTYPAYFGSYERFEEIRQFTDKFPNLFLVGRNGMHKYNNSDHSMLTAMVAVDNIVNGVVEKQNLWSINTEQEYHEEKGAAKATTAPAQPGGMAKGNPGETFKEFLWQNRRNKWTFFLCALAVVLQFSIFKYFYPQAGFINGDSYSYITAAFFNLSINTYPVGYSMFLRLFSVFTNSDTALVAFQYLFLAGSSLGLIFSIFYFYRPGKWVQAFLLVFAVANPVYLYLSNYVSSDPLFIGLSISWFTLLIWILERPTIRLIFSQAIILFITFMVRYNALYYPLLTALALILSPARPFRKVLGIAASVSVVALFIWHTSNQYYKLSGIREFSPFTGWQIANNALYAYRYVDSSQVKPAPPKFRELDHLVRHYFDTTRDVDKHPSEMLVASTVYMWDPGSPLNKYLALKTKSDTASSHFRRWAIMGPLFSDYGYWLIRQYPASYLQYYIWPNAIKYYSPPVEFLGDHNMGRDTIAAVARRWFGYSNVKADHRTSDLKVKLLDFYPILTGVLNVVFLISMLFFYLLNGFKTRRLMKHPLMLAGIFWLFNFGFSVYASPVSLRFQIFPVLISISFGALLLEEIWKMAFNSTAQGSAVPSIQIQVS